MNRLEIMFSLKLIEDSIVKSNGTPDQSRKRTRVLYELNKKDSKAAQNMIEKPIIVVQECQTSTISSKGKIAEGRGLDARTVTTLIGKENKNRPFNDEQAFKLKEIMFGPWKVQPFHRPRVREMK